MPCFWCSSKGGSVVLQEQVSGQARCARNTWRYLEFENLLAHWAVLSRNSIVHSEVWSNCSYGTDCLAGSHGSVSSQTYFSPSHSTNNTRPACSLDLAVPAYCLWGSVKSIQNTSCQVGGLKEQIPEHSQGISKEMLQHVVTPTKCHIQTVKINMNSHQHEMPQC
jgi:hypothetical protein